MTASAIIVWVSGVLVGKVFDSGDDVHVTVEMTEFWICISVCQWILLCLFAD